jgi:hypothetical protein
MFSSRFDGGDRNCLEDAGDVRQDEAVFGPANI